MIDGGYLNNAADLNTLREGVKLCRQLGRRSEWGEYLGEEVYPGVDVRTDDEIDEYIRNTVHTANALTGTCKMGMGKDCVVEPDLKVYGVNGLRVCDSSIIPTIPGGQTATPTVMVADRAAAFILNPRVTVETYPEPAAVEAVSAASA
jgi:choline dehydrogenase